MAAGNEFAQIRNPAGRARTSIIQGREIRRESPGIIVNSASFRASDELIQKAIKQRDEKIDLIFKGIDKAVGQNIRAGRIASKGGVAGRPQHDAQFFIDRVPAAEGGIFTESQRNKTIQDIQSRFGETRETLKSKGNLQSKNASRGLPQTQGALQTDEKLQKKTILGG